MKLGILDKFADWILNQKIVELASERNESISKIKSMADTTNKHLFKLYIFQNSTSRNHWKNEIIGYLELVIDQSWGKKQHRFESDDYFKWLFYNYFNIDGRRRSVENKIKQLISKYSDEPQLINWSEEEFYNKCERFWTNISPYLEHGEIPESIIQILLDEFDIN